MLYIKTENGRQEVQGRTKALTPAQRQVLILCDGERHAEDLGQMVPAGALQPALERLVAMGVQDLSAVVELLTRHLQSTPLMALRLNKLKQLASA